MTQIMHQISQPAAPVPANVNTESTPVAQAFLEAILYKDVIILRTFGIDDKTAQAIDLKLQVDVAQKLLASENAIRRAQSKRLIAAQAGLPTKATTPTPANETQPQVRFFSSVKAAQDMRSAA